MENGRECLDLCCDVCVVDNVDVGCGWVDNCSRLNVVSIVAFCINSYVTKQQISSSQHHIYLRLMILLEEVASHKFLTYFKVSRNSFFFVPYFISE
jgi:hypothetical protein